MTLFNRIATSALLTTVAFGSVAPAMAHHVPQQPFVERESADLLREVQRAGVRVVSGGRRCKKGLMGMAIMSGDRQRQYLVICARNHGNDMAELADTIRHEALHVAQHCRARRLGIDPQPLFPQHADEFIAIAQTDLHWNTGQYDPSTWGPEAEARVGSQVLDEVDVARLVERECGPLR